MKDVILLQLVLSLFNFSTLDSVLGPKTGTFGVKVNFLEALSCSKVAINLYILFHFNSLSFVAIISVRTITCLLE